MFTIVKEPVAWIDIEWSGLDEEGFSQNNLIRMKVALLPLSEMQTCFGGESEEVTGDVIKKVARDWSGVRAEGGKVMEMTSENLELMVEVVPNFARGFQSSYLKAWLGQGREREKNCESSPDGGRAADDQAGTKPAPKSS